MIETLLSFVYSLVTTIMIQPCHKFAHVTAAVVTCGSVIWWNRYIIFVLSQSFMFYFSHELRNPSYDESLGTLELYIAIDGILLKLWSPIQTGY